MVVGALVTFQQELRMEVVVVVVFAGSVQTSSRARRLRKVLPFPAVSLLTGVNSNSSSNRDRAHQRQLIINSIRGAIASHC
jgi:hypothetical protein